MALSEEIKGISVKIGANTTELSKALSDINSQVKGTNTSLREIGKLLKFDPTNTELLAQKQKALKEAIAESTAKTKALKEAQKEAKAMLKDGTIDQGAYDKLSRDIVAAEQQTKKYKDELKDTNSVLKENSKDTEEASEKTSAFADTLGMAAKAAAAAAVAAGAAAVALAKSVVSSFADYEQLTGGIETLFDKSSDQIMKYAENAYKTSGMSANQYMETVTSFSASLINSLDGDTTKAAEQADKAIVQMSDNANKMGTDIESIQNAYKGFAKGNYTMLDNLSLGFSGTKEGMEQLLAKAEEISGVKFDIGSYSDIIDAIGVIQDSMGITGTTAAEAEKTISGSIASTKAAWENLMTSLGSGEGVNDAVNNLTDSMTNVMNNIQPVIERLISALPEVFAAIIPTIQILLPQILSTVTDLMVQVLNVLIQSTPTLIPAIVEMVQMIVTTLVENAPLLLTSAIQLITSLGSGIIEMLPLLADSAVQLITDFVTYVTDNLGDVVTEGGEILNSIIEGITERLPELITTAADLIVQIVTTLIENLPQILDEGIEILNTLIEGIINAIPTLVEMVPQIIVSIITTLVENLPQILAQGVEIIVTLIVGLIQAIPQLILAIPEIIKAIVDAFAEYDWATIGHDLIEGIKKGILQGWENIKEAVTEVAGKIKDKFEDIFGIESPSKWMRDHIGKNLDAGLAVGLDKYKDLAVTAANEVSGAVAGAFSGGVNADYGASARNANLYMTTPVYLDGKLIATVVNNRLGVML